MTVTVHRLAAFVRTLQVTSDGNPSQTILLKQEFLLEGTWDITRSRGRTQGRLEPETPVLTGPGSPTVTSASVAETISIPPTAEWHSPCAGKLGCQGSPPKLHNSQIFAPKDGLTLFFNSSLKHCTDSSTTCWCIRYRSREWWSSNNKKRETQPPPCGSYILMEIDNS